MTNLVLSRPFRRAVALSLAITAIAFLVVAFEASLAAQPTTDKFENPSHIPVHLHGAGSPLLYLVMGDSTAAGRGADAQHGIAIQTAQHLAETHDVTLVNLGVSGARFKDVMEKQIPQAESLAPHLILLSAGANDVAHLTPNDRIKAELKTILSRLVLQHPTAKIVVLGSGDLGTCPRFAQPLRCLAGLRTRLVNADIEATIQPFHQAVWGSLAEKTGPAFAKDQTLFAPDQFHPNNRGYAVWIPFLNEAIDRAMNL